MFKQEWVPVPLLQREYRVPLYQELVVSGEEELLEEEVYQEVQVLLEEEVHL